MTGWAYLWGLNSHHQVTGGGNKDLKQILPVRLRSVRDVVDISCGGYFTLLLTHGGKVFSFGKGQHGRLGRGDQEDYSEPGEVCMDEVVVGVSAGLWHSALVTDGGSIYIWGCGKVMGVKQHMVVPRLVESLARTKISNVACGNNYTLALGRDGSVYSWGSAGGSGVLGHGDTRDRTQPQKIQGLDGIEVTTIDAGNNHCGAVTRDNQVFLWGRAEGWGGKGAVLQPELLRLGEKVTMVSCSVGEHHPHTLILTLQGQVYSCGDGYKGKLGLGDMEGRDTPCLVPGLDGVVQVVAGGIHSAARDRDGRVYSWGCGSDGRLGHPGAEGHR